MATLVTKNSSTAAAVPGTGDLVQGELAVNVADKRLFTKNSGGTVVELGTNPSTLVVEGNVGVGATPSAAIASTTIEIGVNKSGAFGALGDGPTDNAYVSANAYPTGSADPAFTSWKYTRTGTAAKYEAGLGGAHAWYTAPSGTAGNAISFTQAMTLAASGDLLVGTTTNSGAGGITLFNNVTTGFSFVNNNNAAATGYVFSSFRRSSVEIGSITQNGTTAVLYNTTSDRRLKDNISPAPSASDVIDAIEIVSHDWKAAPDEHVTYGVIAQDLALVAPQAVLQGDDGEAIKKTWGVDYSKLVPMLIKEIQSLRARVAALETV